MTALTQTLSHPHHHISSYLCSRSLTNDSMLALLTNNACPRPEITTAMALKQGTSLKIKLFDNNALTNSAVNLFSHHVYPS